MPVSTRAAVYLYEKSQDLQVMRSTLRAGQGALRFGAYALMHAYRDNPIDHDIAIQAFCAKKKERRLAVKLFFIETSYKVCIL